MSDFELAKKYFIEGCELFDSKNYIQSESKFKKSLELMPNRVSTLTNLSAVQIKLKKYSQAESNANKAVLMDAINTEAYLNLGIIENELKRLESAHHFFSKALSLKPDYHEAWSNKGDSLGELKCYDEAMEYFEEALRIKPDYAQARLNKSLINLHLKKYLLGWRDYEWRFKTKESGIKNLIQELTLWNGSHCKNLLITNEQGIGDNIFYSSMLSIVKKQIANVTVSIDNKLIPILTRSFPDIKFVNNNLPLRYDLFDAWIPIGSLSKILNMHPYMPGRVVPFIFDNASLTKVIKNKISYGKKKICGVAWRSSNEKIGVDKSIPLHKLNNIFKIKDYEFINLQYGDTDKEIFEIEKNCGVKISTIEGIDLFNNVDGLLSIIQSCDFIVTTSSITSHLSGALGKPTYLLVPYSAGRIWYWHNEQTSSWYPSISLFSQDQNLQWDNAIIDIINRLKNEAR